MKKKLYKSYFVKISILKKKLKTETQTQGPPRHLAIV